MTIESTRRQFLRRTAAACGGVALGLNASRPARAIEPIQRLAGPEFKFSLAAYSYRDLLTGKPPKLTLFDFIDDCAKFGLEGTELTSYYFPPDVNDEYLRKIKGAAFRQGLDISGTAVGNDFCQPAGPKRDEQLKSVKRWIDRADLMGAPVIRIFSGSVASGQTVPEAEKLAIEAIEECCDYAGQKGIYLALENHGGLTATAEGMLRLIKAVKSPWFGVNMDTGNFHSADVYAELEQIAPYALNVQVKVVIAPAGGAKQATDYSRLAKILRGANYRGYIVLEYEEAEPPREACPPAIAAIRTAFA